MKKRVLIVCLLVVGLLQGRHVMAADLALISVRVEPVSPVIDSNATIFVNYANLGTDASSAASTLVVDFNKVPITISPTTLSTLPRGCSYVSSSAKLTCAIGSIPGATGNSLTFSFTPTATGTLGISALLTPLSTTSDTNLNNNLRTLSVPVTEPPTDLDLELTSLESSAIVGVDSLQYVVNVDNRGPNDANNVSVSLTFPPTSSAADRGGVQASWTTDPTVVTGSTSIASGCSWAETETAQTLTCPMGDASLPPNARVFVAARFRPIVTGALTITAQVTSDAPDSNLADNSGSLALTVTDPVPEEPLAADLGLTMALNPTTAELNGTVTFTLNLTNSGPNIADTIVVTDSWPEGIGFISGNVVQDPRLGGECLFNAVTRQIACSLDLLLLGGSSQIVLQGRVNQAGAFENSATVTSSALDNNAGNNTIRLPFTVLGPVVCGNRQCDPGETLQSCPADCTPSGGGGGNGGDTGGGSRTDGPTGDGSVRAAAGPAIEIDVPDPDNRVMATDAPTTTTNEKTATGATGGSFACTLIPAR